MHGMKNLKFIMIDIDAPGLSNHGKESPFYLLNMGLGEPQVHSERC
jgi:hypothetical protein